MLDRSRNLIVVIIVCWPHVTQESLGHDHYKATNRSPPYSIHGIGRSICISQMRVLDYRTVVLSHCYSRLTRTLADNLIHYRGVDRLFLDYLSKLGLGSWWEVGIELSIAGKPNTRDCKSIQGVYYKLSSTISPVPCSRMKYHQYCHYLDFIAYFT